MERLTHQEYITLWLGREGQGAHKAVLPLQASEVCLLLDSDRPSAGHSTVPHVLLVYVIVPQSPLSTKTVMLDLEPNLFLCDIFTCLIETFSQKGPVVRN